ncbi:hypothetical protein ACFY40_11450 [Streptomyces sp. NPDC012950]|uniref:hypothetical protein n=1 Tax=Streptomyces sp. NPDC012950 TaxID=3364858 RepID=UPI00369E2173
MPYFPVDDAAHSHPKFMAATNAALGLWVRVGSWVAQQLTDGHVPGSVAKLYGTPAQAKSLVSARLWHAAGHDCPRCPQPRPGDYYMHDYPDHGSKSRAEIQELRRRSAESSRRHRDRQAPKPPTPPSDEQLGLDDAEPEPPAARRAQIRPDWAPSREDVHAAQSARTAAGMPLLTADQVDAVTAKFVRRQLDDGAVAVAWGGRWREWAERERPAPQPSPGGTVVPMPVRNPFPSGTDARVNEHLALLAQMQAKEAQQ